MPSTSFKELDPILKGRLDYIVIPLLWDMDEMFGATNGPC
jgi:hypothetical protein